MVQVSISKHLWRENIISGYHIILLVLLHPFFFSGKDPLPWSTRVQIALDSARGLEYIHEHTVPVYIHRDIKPANILLDKKFRAKVVKVSECGR